MEQYRTAGIEILGTTKSSDGYRYGVLVLVQQRVRRCWGVYVCGGVPPIPDASLHLSACVGGSAEDM